MATVTDHAKDQAIRELIAVRAYELWENQGRPHGHDSLHWQAAAQEIISCLPNGATKPAARQAKSTARAKTKTA
ncbi:MAG: hypothetical protein QOH05_4828 [Acetobacteraceae bacterium]|jgi:hypothetical protein|nr:hypothetical protein [Acetobacteraceae bacterium]